MQDIVIVGAGVLGLSAATLLQNTFSETLITIIAAEFPTPSPASAISLKAQNASADYASMWAGAHYRPVPGSSTQLLDERDLAFKTSCYMKRIGREFPESSGVKVLPAAEYLEEPPVEYSSLLSSTAYANTDDQFKVLTKQDLAELNSQYPAAQTKVQWACEYESYVVNVHLYCAWLLKNFIERGGKTMKIRLPDISDAFQSSLWTASSQSRIVVNCSGRNFDKDPSMKIIRGQTVLVRQECGATRTRQNKDGSWSFLIPRPLHGGTVIGGTKEVGDESVTARAETRKSLLENAVKYFPDFVKNVEDFDVICDNVGRRPWRDGGVRVQIEDTANGTVVHGYGVGGRGYELSWGIAERICNLVGIADNKQNSRARL